MKLNKKKQTGATLIAWLIGIGLLILAASAVIKVAPLYVEFNSVKSMMKSVASEPGIKTASKREISAKIDRYLNVNGLYGLQKRYSESKDRSSGTENPFKLTKLRKGNNRNKLSVSYPVITPWIGNLSFLVDFKHSVILGEPNSTPSN